ncbi:MAG: response regulator [Bdellovibrionaceae bacterium]|nr:response regulator [Pseudobdellovibrionaceae bacterium]
MAKILIVDDQQSFLITLEKILITHKHVVRKVDNGFDAAAILQVENYDVLITDAVMPGCSGYDLVTTIRKIEKLKNLPVIMLTGRKNEKDVVKSIAAGVNEYVLKPVHPTVLISKLNSILIKNKIIHPDLVSLSISADARWNDETAIIAISEIGLTIISNFSIPVGGLTELDSDLFKQINMSKPSLRVIECLPAIKQKGFFNVHVLFENLQPNDLENINRWIQSNQAVKAS